MTSARILVVEDDRVVARDLQQQLVRLGHTVVGVASRGDDAVRLVATASPELVLMDIRLDGGTDGIDAARAIRDRHPVPVIYLTAHTDDRTLERASATEPFGYLVKPFDDTQLRTAIEIALYKHRAESRLRASERRYAVTLSSIGDAVIATDEHLAVTFINAAAEVLTGWSRDQALGQPVGAVLPLVSTSTRDRIDPVAGRGAPVADRALLLGRDGRAIAIEHTTSPIVDDGEATSGVVIVFRDLQQRRELEDAALLRESHDRIERAVRGSNIGIWEVELGRGPGEPTVAHWWNVWEQLGHARPLPGDDPQRILDLIHPDDLPRALADTRAFVRGDRSDYETELRVRHGAGGYRWMLSRGLVVRDSAGVPVRLIGSSVDITDRQVTQAALRATEERFRTFVDHASDALFLHDDRLIVIDANRQACDSLDYRRDELIGKTAFDFDPALTPAQLDALSARLDAGELVTFDSVHRRKDGSVFAVEVRARRYREGERTFTVALARDMTERARAEVALREAKETAESANRAKDEFLANVSHEIRTPMNAILGMTKLVLDTPLTDGQRQALDTARSAARNLLGTINDLLDFSKIEAGKLTLDPVPFSLRAALGDSVRALAIRAHRKGLELLCDVGAEVPDALVGDAARLRQVLINLLGNAIKFTEDGEVALEVAAAGPAPGGTPASTIDLTFAVRDTGIGIPPDKQDLIFRAFEQEDMSTTRRYGGTGLGLTIAARLIALMGGRIDVESAVGRGSTFRFTVRCEVDATPGPPPALSAPVALRDLRVLVVDDNTSNRHLLEAWLRGWRMEPTAVGDGMAAMDALWHAVASGRPYAVLLLDARMPGVDGLSVAARIRERAELAATRIILLTSGDRLSEIERGRPPVVDGHLLKPVPQSELLDAIYAAVARGSAAPAATWPVTASADRTLDVLVAEDNELSAQLLDRLLASRGHRAVLARTGREALEQSARPDVDLLLVDLHMPELDGLAVTAAIRERERTTGRRLPIIAVTARSRRQDRARCLAAGVDDFLTKPIAASDLWAAIERVTAVTADDRLAPRTLLAACGDDPAILAGICATLRAQLPLALAAVVAALADGDGPRLRDTAHSLAGIVAALSSRMGEVASDVEDLAADDQLAAAAPLVDRLVAAVPRLIAAIDGVSIDELRRRA